MHEEQVSQGHENKIQQFIQTKKKTLMNNEKKSSNSTDGE